MTSRSAYSARSLAERWECSDGLIRKLVRNGKLQRIEGFPLLRISADEVDRYEGTPVRQLVADPALHPVKPGQEPVELKPEALAPPLPQVVVDYGSAPDWPQAMKRKTAAAYCELSEAAFEREVFTGRLPVSVTLGGREHWHRPALDAALPRLFGDVEIEEEMPEYRRELHERYGIK